MLGFFPDFNPGELFYSACARYQDHAHFRNKGAVSKEIFGSRHKVAWVHLPQHLNRFVASLPPQSRYTADYIIDNYTTLPYFIPFASPERVMQARVDMKRGCGKTILNNIGVQSSITLLPDWLRFCPYCVERDRKTFGECCWHRLHQLPGVEVCPEHVIFLENSSARTRYRASDSEYVSAEMAVSAVMIRHVDRADPIQNTLMCIAHDAKWLLSQRNLLPERQVLLDCYLKLLAERGLATRSGFVRQEKLRELLANRYPLDFWLRFHGVISERNSWLTQMLYILRTKHTTHPLQHLLMIQALGYTAKEFFHECISLTHRLGENITAPFGKAPWPCLNKTSEHYRQGTIVEYQLTYTREPNSRPKGIFACNCGFAYARVGPDISDEDKYRSYRVESYGSLWDATLTRLWADSSLSVKDICDSVGLGFWEALRKQATRLGLTFPRIGPKGLSGKSGPSNVSTYLCKRIPGPRALSVYRREWLEGIKKNPEARSTKALIRDKTLALIYRRLLKHDPQWLDANALQSDRSVLTLARANSSERYWERLDLRLAPRVEEAAQRLREKVGRPVRISQTAIMRESILKTHAFKYLNKLPKTSGVLAKYVEAPAELTVRRLQWAAARFREERIVPTKTKLMNRAGICTRYWERDAIKMAAETVLSAFAEQTVGL
jgi:hypothetical protein